MAEYAIVLAGLAVVCLVAAVFVGAAIQGRFESTNTPTPANPFEPPPTRAVPQPNSPTAIAECEDGGWRNFPQFDSEAECRRYVENSPTAIAECDDGGWRNFPQFESEAECRRYVDSLLP